MEAIPSIKYVSTSDGASIAYWTIGSGPPLVHLSVPLALHTELSWRHEAFSEWMRALSASNTVTFFDWRGTGLSESPEDDLSLEAQLRDLTAVVDAVAPDRCALFAMWASGIEAIAFAARNPAIVSKLVLFNVWASDKEYFLRSPVTSTRELASVAPEEYARITAVTVGGLRPPQGTLEHLSEVVLFNNRRVLERQGHARWLMDQQSTNEVGHLLSRVTAKTLVLHRDELTHPDLSFGRATAAGIPGAEFRTVRGDSFMPHIGDIPEVADLVNDFLLDDGEVEETLVGTAFRTILFSDVVASTPLLVHLKDEKMRAVMRDHDEVLEAAVTDNGGRVVKTIGDAFMAEFAVPSGAVEAAIAAQRGIRDKFADSDVPICLRIGINAGEPIEEDGDLPGASVVIAKRLESEAENGSILVSDVVRSAVAGKEFEFVDRGEVSLKGFDEPVRAWSVEW